MKRAKILNLLVATLLLAIATIGCKKNPKNITNIPGRQPDMNAPGMAGMEDGSRRLDPGLGVGTSQIPINPNPTDIAAPIDGAEDREALAQQTVYFDFDRHSIKPSEQPKLEEVATYMKNNPNTQLRVEGHCDERGTEEYNRALGERRAIAAREFLIQKHNIPSGRITTVSYGEDKPADTGMNESAYARNRRDEFVILTPQ